MAMVSVELRGRHHWCIDLGFAELAGCMSNAERAGFTGTNYQVHARSAFDAEQET
jgi:hypothetical protein